MTSENSCINECDVTVSTKVFEARLTVQLPLSVCWTNTPRILKYRGAPGPYQIPESNIVRRRRLFNNYYQEIFRIKCNN